MSLRSIAILLIAFCGARALAGADFRKEQHCMAMLRDVSTSSLLTESIPVKFHKVIVTDRDDDKAHDELVPSADEVIVTPAPGNREIFLYTGDMRFKCQLPKLSLSSKYIRFILEDTAFSREYVELGISKDRKQKVEISSKLKSNEIADMALGLLLSLGLDRIAVEVGDALHERTLSKVKEVKCRASLDVQHAKSELRFAIADRVDGLEKFFALKVAEMDRSLKNLCKSSDCEANPALADKTELAHDRIAEDLVENILGAAKACAPAVADDANLTRRLEQVVRHFTQTHQQPLSAQGGVPAAY